MGTPSGAFVNTVLRPNDVGDSTRRFLSILLGPVAVDCDLPVGDRRVAPKCSGVVGTVQRKLRRGGILGPGCRFDDSVSRVGSCRRLTVCFKRGVGPSLFFNASHRGRGGAVIMLGVDRDFFSMSVSFPRTLDSSPAMLRRGSGLVCIDSVRFNHGTITVVRSSFSSRAMGTTVGSVVDGARGSRTDVLSRDVTIVTGTAMEYVAVNGSGVRRASPSGPLGGLVGCLGGGTAPRSFNVPVAFSTTCLGSGSMFIGGFAGWCF